MSDLESFQNVDNWLADAREQAQTNPIISVIGNKCDVTEHVVSQEMIDNFSKRTGLKVTLCSAKTNENVEELFLDVVKQLKDKKVEEPKKGTELKKQPEVRKTNCC